ncbi:hypothetical protein [Spirosoma jeollabukense]
MKIDLKLIPVVIICGLSACIWDGSSTYEKQLNGPYYLEAYNDYNEMSIGIEDKEIRVGVIKATVFAIGQTDQFIVAKQHPLNESRNIDKSITNYFIIPLNQKISKATDRNYFGPLTLDEFNGKRHELGMDSVPFTIVFKDLK